MVLETLVFYYIKINYKDELGNSKPSLEHGASISQKSDDGLEELYAGYSKYKDKKKKIYNRLYDKG